MLWKFYRLMNFYTQHCLSNLTKAIILKKKNIWSDWSSWNCKVSQCGVWKRHMTRLCWSVGYQLEQVWPAPSERGVTNNVNTHLFHFDPHDNTRALVVRRVQSSFRVTTLIAVCFANLSHLLWQSLWTQAKLKTCYEIKKFRDIWD